MEDLVGKHLSRYHVLEKIGAGGMGAVYRARDGRLERDVAIKVLHGSAVLDEASRLRFRTEALALSRLTHPNIGVLYDFDAQDGIDFLVLEYVAGTTLARRLRGGPLPEDDVRAIGLQVSEAMEAAHEQGIVHRDVKPGNILLTPAGRAKLVDFGIAKLLRPIEEQPDSATLTETGGFPAGTLPYMAPEQLRGERVDVRTDLYALGVVLFEMSTGRLPYRTELSTALVDAILHDVPQRPRALRPELSAELEGIILKSMGRDPASRYQSAHAMSTALKGKEPSPSVARNRRVPKTGAMVRSLAVLPLENLSRDPAQEYFADGMTEEVATRLAQVKSLRVIARTSAMRFKGTQESIATVGRELNVDAVIQGSVLRVNDHVRVTVQLVRAATEEYLWAKSYERELKDVFALQSEVARSVARAIRLELTTAERERLAESRPVSPKAHEAYLHGRYLWNQRTEESLDRSIAYFEDAIAEDSTYALAYSGLASAHLVLPAYRSASSLEVVTNARKMALRALELDPSLGEAHAILAGITGDFDWDSAASEEGFRHAVEMAPNSATVRQWYGEFLMRRSRFSEAREQYSCAVAVDPLSPIASAMMADLDYVERNYDRALARAKQTLERFPEFKRIHVFLGNIYLAQGKYEEALGEHAVLGLPGAGEIRSAFLASGPQGYWQKLLEIRLELNQREYMSPVRIAIPYAKLGDNDRAFSWLERSREAREMQLTYYLVSHYFDELRTDPRFRTLRKRIGLE